MFQNVFFWGGNSERLVLLIKCFINVIEMKFCVTLNNSNAYLKKSFLQYSRPSLEKHLSVKLHLQSQHCTHLACQALSKTLSKNLSRIGLSHPAQWTIFCDSGHHVAVLVRRQKSM